MGVKFDELVPEMQAALRAVVADCADDSWLKAEGLQLVITEGRRKDYQQALYFCHGRTQSEILAALDRVGADEKTRDTLSLAIEEMFGNAASANDRAPGRIITNALPYTGPHCLGVAFHFRIKHGAHVLPDTDTPWEFIGRIVKKHGLVWGGDWAMRDMEHCELPKKLWPSPETVKVAA